MRWIKHCGDEHHVNLHDIKLGLSLYFIFYYSYTYNLDLNISQNQYQSNINMLRMIHTLITYFIVLDKLHQVKLLKQK